MQTIVILIAVLVNISLVLKTSVVARAAQPNSQVSSLQPRKYESNLISYYTGLLKFFKKPPNSENFETKYESFKKQLRKTSKYRIFWIYIWRDLIFDYSYMEIKYASKNQLLASWFIVYFDGEKGSGRGLVREWFCLITQEIINPSRKLFQYIDEENFFLRINPRSVEEYGEEHLEYFKFVGKVFGLAVFHNMRLKASLIKPFFLTMLGRKVELKHVERFDPTYHRSLKIIKENPREMGLTFSVDEIVSNERVVHNLKENGDNISVTEDNVDEYIDLLIQWNYVSSVQQQMSAFLEGFHLVVPSSLLEKFDENELELIMCGDAKSIDVEDWKNNTRYSGYKKDSEIISWFWKIVGEFDSEKKSKLLQYVTGMSTLPIGGFKELKLKFSIAKKGNRNDFPGASTCKYTLYLPPYESYQRLEDELNALIVGEFNSEKKSKLLQYVTGSFILPIGGFKELKHKFGITKKGNQNDFPGANICLYILYLPPYESYERLEEELNALVASKESTKFSKFFL